MSPRLEIRTHLAHVVRRAWLKLRRRSGKDSAVAKPKTAARKAATKSKPAGAKVTRRRKPVAKAPATGADDRLERLWESMSDVRAGRRTSPRTARLLAAGVPKMAQKVVEEAAEVAIEAVQDRREALVNESVDLLYNLAALWNASGVRMADLWAEMDRREAALGTVEKLPKADEV
jgi:phosphoribosyl-ATP pyrophosphohydrolase